MEAIESGNMPEAIKDKEKQLKRDIAQYQNVIYEEDPEIQTSIRVKLPGCETGCSM